MPAVLRHAASDSPAGDGIRPIGQTTVALGWNASTDNVGVAGYNLFRDGVSVATVSTPGYTYTASPAGQHTFALARV